VRRPDLATQEGTSIGRTMTILIIFVIVVVVVVVIFAYFNGLFKFVNPGGGSMAASGYFALTGGGGTSGVVAIQVMDTSHVSITGVTFACSSAQFTNSTCSGLQIDLSGTLVSSKNPLNFDQTGSGSQLVQAATGTAFTPGTVYTVTVTSTFSDGSTLSETLSLPAQVG